MQTKFMKKHLYLTFLLVGITTVSVSLLSNASGPGGNRTGSPGSSGNCASCHGGTSNYGGTISSYLTAVGDTTKITQYTPGTAYDYYVNVGGTSSRKGFQSTIINAAGNAAGTVSSCPIGTISYTSGATKTIWGHNSPSTTGLWKCTWTAPASGTGTVTIYSCAVVSNSNGSDSKDQVVSTNTSILEKSSGGSASIENFENQKLKLFGNPVNTSLQMNKTVRIALVWNNAGQVVAKSENCSNLDVSTIASGNYILQVQNFNGKHEVISFVK